MKKRIISAFKDLSQLKGLKNITMDELAAKAGVSKRTIYRHYASKEDIIYALIQSFMAESEKLFDNLLNKDKNPEVIFTELMKHLSYLGSFINPMILHDLKQYYPHIWEKIENFRTEKIHHFLISLTKYNNLYLRKVDPAIMTSTFTASIQAVLNPDFILSHNLKFEQAARQLMELLLYGFLKDKK